MQYSMKGQEYILPENASDISGEDEAGRIRWLATYSSSDRLFEAARTLLQEYDRSTMETSAGTLIVPALLFALPLNRTAYMSLAKARQLRDEVLAAYLPMVEGMIKKQKATEQQKSLLLKGIQTVLDDDCLDASWWGLQDTVKDAIADFDSHVRIEYRKLVRDAK